MQCFKGCSPADDPEGELQIAAVMPIPEPRKP